MTSVNLTRISNSATVCWVQPFPTGNPLALAHTCPPSACPCKPPLAPAEAHPSFACHCEPVRTLVRQSASPQKSLASWHHFGQIRSPFRIRPKYYSPLCPAARSADCHVASLLAMTCRNLPGVCVCKNVLPWQIRSPFRIRPKYYSPLCPGRKENGLSRRFAPRNDRGGGVLANRCKMGTGAHLCGPEKAMQRSDLSPGFSGGKAGAKDTQLVSPRCGNPHPRRETLQAGRT